MSRLDDKTVDQVALKLSGLIGVFEMMMIPLRGDRSDNFDSNIMLDFYYFISGELQNIFKSVSGVEYNS
jgi:hypothetical protein